jgi:hypothetical protein
MFQARILIFSVRNLLWQELQFNCVWSGKKGISLETMESKTEHNDMAYADALKSNDKLPPSE